VQPPPYQPPPQNPYTFGLPPVPPKRGMSCWAITGIVLGGGYLLLLIPPAILFPIFDPGRERWQQLTCQSQLRLMSNASLMYAQDNDNKLPPSSQWMDRLERYTGHFEGLYDCPIVAPGGDQSDPSRSYGYAMDSRLSGKSVKTIKTPQYVILLYDSTNTTRNATDAGTSRAARHVNGANVGYADGHVKHVKTGVNK